MALSDVSEALRLLPHPTPPHRHAAKRQKPLHRVQLQRAKQHLERKLAGKIATMRDDARFITTLLANPSATGAVTPSSRALARRMARYVDPSRPGPIVELGPGTGPVTEALLERGIAPERLVLVEFEPAFCDLLARRFPGVRVVQGDAYNLQDTLAGVLDTPAAAIVSSLPLLNRPEADRLHLLADAFALMGPKGVFIQFTYGMVSPMPLSQRGAQARVQMEASAPVWLNIPPARVFAYRASTGPASSQLGNTHKGLPHGLLGVRDAFLSKWKLRAGKLRRHLIHQARRITAP